MADKPVRKTSQLSSAIFRTFQIRCCQCPYSLCLLIHYRLCYRINVYFFVEKFYNFPCCFQPLVKPTILQWTLEHDLVMRSTERGQIWWNIAATLNSLQQPKSSVTASRAVRERYTHLTSKQKQKLCDEEEASNIE